MQSSQQHPAQGEYSINHLVLFISLMSTSALPASIPARSQKGNNLTQPPLVFDTPCTTWEQTQAALIAIGVPHNQLDQWHNLWLWADIERSLQSGWDPKEGIDNYLNPFLENLGSRRFRCTAPVRGGNPGLVCGWEGTKKDRAISHVCGHFGYNAWICDGTCGRPW